MKKLPHLQPPSLQKGALIAIVSTARKLSESALTPALIFAKNAGLKVHLGATIGAEYNQYAGTDALRAQDFQEALDHPDVKAIWCARGGYGTVRIIDMLDFTAFLQHPKWIVGYSDITVLHTHVNKLGVQSIHGQMCLEIEKRTQISRDTLKDALFGNFNSISYAIENQILHRTGIAQGRLLGGNLSVLYSVLDSPSEIDWEGCVLFIEDLDEMLYHVDRMLQNLKRSGRLANLSGLIVGGMSVMRDNTIPFGKTAIEIIAEAVQEYHYPLCFNFPAGHIEDNRAIVFGAEVRLEVTAERVHFTYNE